MEGEKGGEYSLKRANGNSVQFMERDCGDYIEVTPEGTFLDRDGLKMVQGAKRCLDEQISDDPDYVTFRFPAIVYKFPKNIHELDMTERKKVVIQIWLEAVQTVYSYFTIGLNEAEAMAGNPDQVVDQDAFKKLCEEIKMKLNLDEDGVKKLCEEIKMKLNLD